MQKRSMDHIMTRIVVASKNPVKIKAVERAFTRMFPEQHCELIAMHVESGVSDQPMSSHETWQGAQNRVTNARRFQPDADMWIGIEGGIEDSAEGMYAFAWIVVLSPSGRGQGRTATFFLPQQVTELVRSGTELGHANDLVFGHENSKQKGGAIGSLTDQVVDRTALYEQGVVMALVPFKKPDLYPRA